MDEKKVYCVVAALLVIVAAGAYYIGSRNVTESDAGAELHNATNAAVQSAKAEQQAAAGEIGAAGESADRLGEALRGAGDELSAGEAAARAGRDGIVQLKAIAGECRAVAEESEHILQDAGGAAAGGAGAGTER